MRGVSCCRCFDGFGEKKGVEGRDVEDFEVELGVNEVIFWRWNFLNRIRFWRVGYSRGN